MTRDQIIALVLSRLGKREGNAYLVQQAELELNLIIDTELELGALLPWFLLTNEVDIACTTSYPYASYPADFLREWDEYPLKLYDASVSPATYTELVKDDLDLLFSQYRGEAAGPTPVKYGLAGFSIEPFPRPSVAVTFRSRYYARTTPLSDSNATSAWTTYASDLLVAKLGKIMSRYARAPDMKAEFEADERIAWNRVLTEDTARKNAAREAYRGD